MRHAGHPLCIELPCCATNSWYFVDSLSLDAPRPKICARFWTLSLVLERSALVLMAERNENVERSTYNLTDAQVLRANYLNIRDLLQYDKVIVPLDALDIIKSHLGSGELTWPNYIFTTCSSRPVVTEKAAVQSDELNQYVFEVAPEANKIQIKEAIEVIFEVDVVKVNTMVMPAKRGRRGRNWYRALPPVEESCRDTCRRPDD